MSSQRACILLGAPGSGKGTQAKRLQNHFSIPHISTGDILRAEVAAQSDLGLKVKAVIDAGLLVNDDLMIELIEKRFKESDVRAGFILDGFPRNEAQAEMLDKALGRWGFEKPKAIYLELKLEALVRRMVGRLTCSNCGSIFHQVLNPPKKAGVCDVCGASSLTTRKDDNEETAKKRIGIFLQETSPLLNFYKNKGALVAIDGAEPLDVITEKMKSVL